MPAHSRHRTSVLHSAGGKSGRRCCGYRQSDIPRRIPESVQLVPASQQHRNVPAFQHKIRRRVDKQGVIPANAVPVPSAAETGSISNKVPQRMEIRNPYARTRVAENGFFPLRPKCISALFILYFNRDLLRSISSARRAASSRFSAVIIISSARGC